MACKCIRCGKPMEDCESELCKQCLIDWCYSTDVEKKRFYGEESEKEEK